MWALLYIYITIWLTSYRNQQFCLFFCLFVHLSCLSIRQLVHLSVCLLIYSSIPEFMNNSYLRLFVYFSIGLIVHLFVCPHICLSSACNTNSLVSYFLVVFEAGKKILPLLRQSRRETILGLIFSRYHCSL